MKSELPPCAAAAPGEAILFFAGLLVAERDEPLL